MKSVRLEYPLGLLCRVFNVSRSGFYAALDRPPSQWAQDYEPGSVHIDIKYLPQMPDETSRRYLFVAIDRATRWVFLHSYHDMSDTSSVDFLRQLKDASPMAASTNFCSKPASTASSSWR